MAHADTDHSQLTADPIARAISNDEGTHGFELVFDADAPPDALLDILWDPEKLRTLMPEILEAKVVADLGSYVDVAFRVDAVVRKFSYVVRRSLDRKAREITWREVSGDVRRYRGSWRIEDGAQAGTSRCTYVAFLDAGWMLPSKVIRELGMRKANDIAASVRTTGRALYLASLP